MAIIFMRQRIHSLRGMQVFFILMIGGLLTCCSSSSKNQYVVGIDPMFYPQDFSGKGPYVLGFSIDLLQAIAQIERIPIQRSTISWDNLLEGLNKHQYQAILSSMESHLFNADKFQFSENYLDTGPVLVIKKNGKDVLKLKEIQVAVSSEELAALAIEHYPSALVKIYETDLKGLQATESGQVDAALVDQLVAVGYVNDLFRSLQISSEPLNDVGLKLVTLHKSHPPFIKYFNRGLEELKRSGEYEKLLLKWKLAPASH